MSILREIYFSLASPSSASLFPPPRSKGVFSFHLKLVYVRVRRGRKMSVAEEEMESEFYYWKWLVGGQVRVISIYD